MSIRSNNFDSGSVPKNIDVGASTKVTGYYRGEKLVALKVVNKEMSVNIKQAISQNAERDLRDLTSGLKPIISLNTQIEKVHLDAHEQTPFTPTKPLEKEAIILPENTEQTQEAQVEQNHAQGEEVGQAEQIQGQAEEEIEAAEQAAAEPEEVPENVLEEMSLLSHGTLAHAEQEQPQQSSRSTYANNKNEVQSETQKRSEER